MSTETIVSVERAEPRRASLKAAVGRAVYPTAARLLRAYLIGCPVRAGKSRLLALWLKHMNWRRNHAFVAMSSHGIRFRITMFDSVGAHLYLTGMWESGTTDLMVGLLRAGDVFVDVGANIGYHTLLAAKLVGPSGRVIAIEPAPHIRRMLEDNLALNPGLARHANIVMMPYGVSDRHGVATLFAPAAGNSGETTLRPVDEAAIPIAVETRTLDEILDGVDLSRCPLLKMDIEGAEGLALAGADLTLRRYPSLALVLEVHDAYLRALGSSAADLLEFFRSRGYHAYTISAPRANLDGTPTVLLPLHRAPDGPRDVLFTREPQRFERWRAATT